MVYSSLIFASGFNVFGAEPRSSTNAPAASPSMMEMMIDPEDGQFDVSAWLATAKGFFPIPIIITEPAVGYGGGLALMFLHDSIKDRVEKIKERNPDGTASEGRLVLKGGTWSTLPNHCRTYSRSQSLRGGRWGYCGFRCVIESSEER